MGFRGYKHAQRATKPAHIAEFGRKSDFECRNARDNADRRVVGKLRRAIAIVCGSMTKPWHRSESINENKFCAIESARWRNWQSATNSRWLFSESVNNFILRSRLRVRITRISGFPFTLLIILRRLWKQKTIDSSMMFFESDRLFVFDFNDLDEAHLLEPLKSLLAFGSTELAVHRLFNFQEVSFGANAQIPKWSLLNNSYAPIACVCGIRIVSSRAEVCKREMKDSKITCN